MTIGGRPRPGSEGVRRVIGKRTDTLSGEQIEILRRPYPRTVVDVGTGDGRHAQYLARRRPDWWVLGLDSNPDALSTISRKAAAREDRGGIENLIFVWESVERFPSQLAPVDEVHVLMPWGSLLRTVVLPDTDLLDALAEVCSSKARFEVVVNLHPWSPQVPEVLGLEEPTVEHVETTLTALYGRAGWRIEQCGLLSPAQVHDLHTTWTNRIGSSREAVRAVGFSGSIDGRWSPVTPQDGGSAAEVACGGRLNLSTGGSDR